MFIAELLLYISYLKEKLEEGYGTDELNRQKKYFTVFYKNLVKGISYYYHLSAATNIDEKQFAHELSSAELELELLLFQYPFLAE